MKTLLVEAQLKNFGRVKDGAVNFAFRSTREMTNEEFRLIDEYYQQNGWLAFKIDEFDGSEMPDENTKISGQKSPSQYLRTCLFAKHMHNGGTKDTFPAYYQKAINGFAQAVIDSY